MKRIVLGLVLAVALVFPALGAGPVFAAEPGASCPPPDFKPPVFSGKETPEEKGLAVAWAVRKRDSGWESQLLNNGVAVLKNVRGEERVLKFRAKLLEKAPDGAEKTFFLFDEPADVKGFGALSYIFPFAPEEQWFFLPELQRVKRISGDNRTSSFLGTEFTNEDVVIGFPVVERYTYKYIREEECEGLTCYVIDRFPAYEHSGYKRYRLWIDQKEFRFQKIEFYDRKDELIKTLYLKKYELYLHWWRWTDIAMINHHTGKSTTVSYDWKLCAGLTDDDFSINALKRAR